MTNTPEELELKFWKALKSDRTVMLGLQGVDGDHTRPMTAQIEGDTGGPIWFFGSKDSALVEALTSSHAAVATFASKGHDLFASVQGKLTVNNDPAMIDALWNPFVAAWYKGGKTDPTLALLRFDAASAEIWLDASNILTGLKMLIGIDPQVDYKDNVAKVALS